MLGRLVSTEISNGVLVVGHQLPLCGQQTFDSDGSTSVNTSGADTDLSAQAKSEAISKPGTGVVEYTGTVHLSLSQYKTECRRGFSSVLTWCKKWLAVAASSVTMTSV